METSARSIGIDREKCRRRMACLRACPTQAIRVRERSSVVLDDRCIDCGECVRACPNRAVVARTGSIPTSRFKHTVALPSPVLYSQVGKDVAPASVLNALTRIGFNDAHDVACASEAVSIAIQEYLETHSTPRPLISPFCPAIVRLIQVRFPNLLDNLIPIDSPMEIAAREAKRQKMQDLGLSAQEIGVIYLTPCPAKMIAIETPPRKSHSFVDGTIAISEIFPALLRALGENNSPNGKSEVRGLGLAWPIVGGQIASLRSEDCLAVGGVHDVIRMLDDLENGRLKDIQYIECHSCSTACVGGSLTVLNPYVARSNVVRMVEKNGSRPCQDREKIRELFRKNYFSLPGTIPPTPLRPIAADVTVAIEKLHQKQWFYSTLPKIDCGACGSPNCDTLAEDVVTGTAEADDCVFLAMKKFEAISGTLMETVLKHSRRVPSTIDGEES